MVESEFLSGKTTSIVNRILRRNERLQVKGQEVAINASNRTVLSQILESSATGFWERILDQYGLNETYMEKLECKRVYFGNEFCQMLMPSSNELEEVVSALEDQNVGVTLLTPYVTDQGIRVIIPLLDFLNRRAQALERDYEIVVNDWGVLRIVKSSYQSLNPVLGRLMLKMKKDPRFSFSNHKAFAEQFNVIQQCSLTVPIYRDFLRSFNVKRVELDFLEQGIDMDFSKWDMEASLHFPINYITTSRRCPMASLDREPDYKLKFYNVGCKRECQRYETQLVRQDGTSIGGVPPTESKVFYEGNTVFSVPQWINKIQPLQRLADVGVDRIIFAPKIPM